MDFSARVTTKDATRTWRRRSCTRPRSSSTPPRTLMQLRDTLLGPLFSGELTTKSAQKAVGAAL